MMKIKAVVKVADGCCCRGCRYMDYSGNEYGCELFQIQLKSENSPPKEPIPRLTYKCELCLKSEVVPK